MDHSLSVWMLDPANLTPFYCSALCSALGDNGDRVRFITSEFLHDPDFQFPRSIEVDYHYFRHMRTLQRRAPILRRVWRGVSYSFNHASFLRKAARQRPDVIHVQWSRLPIFDYRLIKRLQKLGIPVVHTVHDVEPLYSRSGGASSLEQVYHACDGLIVHTEANRNELLERYRSVAAERIHVIPHGPLQAELCPAGATQAQARSELGIPVDAPIALFFGTIKHYKGLDVLIDAFAKVHPSLPSAWLLVGGHPAGSSDVPDFSPLAKAKAAWRADLGFIPNEQVWRYYLAADVVVLPYRNITQSGVLLAAMAYGKACIVTAVGGLPEVIDASGAGWVVPVEDSAKLAEVMHAALAQRAVTQQKGTLAKEFVERQFSWKTIARLTHQLYQQVIAQRSKS